MVSNTDASKRPTVWPYVNFQRLRRRSSVRLPHREVSDLYEKSDRLTSSGRQRQESMTAKIQAAWMNQSQRSRLIKTGCLIAFFLFAIYYILPTGNGRSILRGGNVASDPSVTTTKCTRSYSKSKPLIQYALMIDAGSTGSRIHVYRFNNCGPTPELEDEVFAMTEKKEGGSGLSSYGEDAYAAARSLDPLLKVALEKVPDVIKSCTPIAVKATAGLRKLGSEASDNILKAVRQRLERYYPFPLVDDEHGGVQVMEGTDEGVYAWITTNYLLGNIGSKANTPTAAVFDLGGGSTQIVFQPTFPKTEEMRAGDHKYHLSFGGREFDLYQHSYLGYGLMEARNLLHLAVVKNVWESTAQYDYWLETTVVNPCLGVDTTREVDVALDPGNPFGQVVQVNMTGPTTPQPELCSSLAEKTLNKDKDCRIKPCAFNGVHQPSLETTFAREDIYLFSYFYDRTSALGMPEKFTLRELKDVATRVCQGGDGWKDFENVPGAIEELQGRPEFCLDLNFMLALLHKGYEMPIDREVKVAKKINGNELGWCLGASLPLLSQESGWKCKISEVF